MLGFVIDIVDPRSTNFGWVLLWCAYSGGITVLYVFAIMRGPKLLVVAVVGQIVGTLALAHFAPQGAPLIGSGDAGRALKTRLTLDGIGLVISITAGWAFVAAFVNRQAFEHVLTT